MRFPFSLIPQLHRVRLVCNGKCTVRSTSDSTTLVRAPRGPFLLVSGVVTAPAAAATDAADTAPASTAAAPGVGAVSGGAPRARLYVHPSSPSRPISLQ